MKIRDYYEIEQNLFKKIDSEKSFTAKLKAIIELRSLAMREVF